MIRSVAALVLGLSALVARADEKDVPLDKVPAKAMAAVKNHFPNAKLIEASTDTVDDVVEYTVTLSHNKNTYEVTVTEDGKILEIARETEFKELPKPVRAAFHKRHPKAKVDGVWEQTVPGVKGKTFQIDFTTADGKDATAEYDTEGKLLSEDGVSCRGPGFGDNPAARNATSSDKPDHHSVPAQHRGKSASPHSAGSGGVTTRPPGNGPAELAATRGV